MAVVPRRFRNRLVVAIILAVSWKLWLAVKRLGRWIARRPSPPPPAASRDPGGAPPRWVEGGGVICTSCRRAVPFASMSLDERGYFCARCAAQMG
jgi:hypothetical protein